MGVGDNGVGGGGGFISLLSQQGSAHKSENISFSAYPIINDNKKPFYFSFDKSILKYLSRLGLDIYLVPTVLISIL